VINSDKKLSLYAKKPLNIDVGTPPNVSTPNGRTPEHNAYIRKRNNALKLADIKQRNTDIKPKPKGTLVSRRRSSKIRKTLEVLHFVLLVSINKLQIHSILIIAQNQ
jgi:hypothetical protein